MLGSQQGYAQIPVTVTTQVTDYPMTVAEFASNTTRWAQQVQQMTSQIDQMKQQYGALTGSRGLGRVSLQCVLERQSLGTAALDIHTPHHFILGAS
nr:type IV secretion system protein [Pseudomonas qingdaonensis]